MKFHMRIAAVLGLLAAAPALAMPPDAVPLSVTPAQLLAPARSLALDLPGGRRLEFATQVRASGPGEQGIRGLSPAGDRLLAYRHGSHLYADIWSSGGRYHLAEETAGLYWTASYTRNWTETRIPRRTSLPAPRQAPVAPPDAGGIYTIDLLVLYSADFVQAWGSLDAALAAAHHLVFIANETLARSTVPARYNLVGMVPAPPGDSYPAAESIHDTPGVVELREAYGADLVAVVIGGTCAGQATLFNNGTPTPDGSEPTDVDAEHDAFISETYTPTCADSITGLSHELGHALGGGHEPLFGGLQDVPNPVIGYGYWKSYAHGTRCGNAGAGGALKYDSIMDYGLPYGTDPDGDFFSNPAYSLDGEACGSDGTPGLEATQANNVKSMTLAAPYVAAYRAPVASPRSSPSASPSFVSGALGAGVLPLILVPLLRRRFRWASPVR